MVGGALNDVFEQVLVSPLHHITYGLMRYSDTTLTSIVIDQFEEVLTNSDPAEASRFLGLLRATFVDPGTPVMVLCTLRSDFFQHFQLHAQLQNLAFEILQSLRCR